MKTQDIKNIATALKNIREADMKPEVKKALAKSSAASEKGKKAVTLPKAPFKMEGSGLDYNPAKGGYNQPKGKEVGKRVGTREAIDPVDKKELKGKHKDRKDKDIDNDGDVDSSDKFLHKRRKAVSKAIASKKKPSAEKDADVEVQEAATATQKPNNGADAEDGLSPNGKKMMAMKTDAPEGADITKVAPKTFAAMRASGKKAAMRPGDNATGESKIKPSATDAK